MVVFPEFYGQCLVSEAQTNPSPLSFLNFLSFISKALGEAALVAEGGCLPIGIVRPSIVAAAWREPLPGWIEGLAGTTGIIAGIGKGLLRSSFCK